MAHSRPNLGCHRVISVSNYTYFDRMARVVLCSRDGLLVWQPAVFDHLRESRPSRSAERTTPHSFSNGDSNYAHSLADCGVLYRRIPRLQRRLS